MRGNVGVCSGVLTELDDVVPAVSCRDCEDSAVSFVDSGRDVFGARSVDGCRGGR